ncbi:MAG: hypothetical protein JW760_02415 [Spirochaetales bacterium]|nr:hypothetical protein [Spirochaetales bacterium]
MKSLPRLLALPMLLLFLSSCELLYTGADPVAEVVSAVVEDINDPILAGYLDVGYRVTNYGTKNVPGGSRVEFTAWLYDTSIEKQVAVDFWAAAFPMGGLPPGRTMQSNVSVDYYMRVDIGNVDAARSTVSVRGVRMMP